MNGGLPNQPRWFGTLFLTTLLTIAAVHAVRPAVSYQALKLGGGPFELGLLASSFALLSVVVAVPIGRWVDRIGGKPFLVAGPLFIAGAAFANIWAGSVTALIATQALLGLGHISLVVSSQTFVANGSEPGARDHRFGQYAVFASLGQLAGPALLGGLAGGALVEGELLGDSPTVTAFAVAGFIGALAGVAALTLPALRPVSGASAPVVSSVPLARPRSVRQMLRYPGMVHAILASVVILASIDLLVAYLPAYGEANGLSVQLVGTLLAIRAGFSMVSRVFMGRLVTLVGRPRLLFASMCMAALGLGVLPVSNETPVLVGVMCVIGLGLGLGQPLTLAWVADQAPRNSRGLAIGVRLTGNRLGQLIIPVFLGAVAGAAGLSILFWGLAGALGGVAGIVAGIVLRSSAWQGDPPEHRR